MPVENPDVILQALLEAARQKTHLATRWRRSGANGGTLGRSGHQPIKEVIMTRLAWLGSIVCIGGLVVARTSVGLSWAQVVEEVGQTEAVSSHNDDDEPTIFRFSKNDVGKAPAGWIVGVTGSQKGSAPQWEVLQDDGRTVLAQLESGGANGDFPVCLKQGSSFKEGTVSVRLKPISGKKDQAGGIVFRAKDKDNFYVARANALENNVSIYYTQNGKRATIKYWQNIDVALGEWHELEVEAKGFTFKVSLNGQLVGEIEDTKRAFPDAGMVGVWTKADSVTYFDYCALAADDDHDDHDDHDDDD
jgi:hypothetical protein